MKTRIGNRLNMYKAEIKVCTANEPVWNTIPAFGQYLDEMIAKVDELESVIYQQMQAIVGVRAIRDEERLITAEKAEIVASALRSLAAGTGNTGLSEQMRFRFSELIKGRIQRSLLLMDRIIEAAGNYAYELMDHGITSYEIDDLITARDQLRISVGTPRDAIVLRKTLTGKIDELVKEIDALLKNHLDKLIKVLRQTSPKFYAHYVAARNVVDYKGKSNKPKPDDNPPPSDPPSSR